jgi:hypothetical protein
MALCPFLGLFQIHQHYQHDTEDAQKLYHVSKVGRGGFMGLKVLSRMPNVWTETLRM